MPNTAPLPLRRILLTIGLGTGLSLMGDAALYAVLPTNVTAAGVSLASVGILLSANRFIRLALNGPAGLLYDRWPRRRLFVPALFLGALSTALYALTRGFWPLLVGRLLWGTAWTGIWVGGNTIILDVTDDTNRGRWVGLYQTAFFLGSLSGSLFGGLFTDWLGYHAAMGIGAVLTGCGALTALLFLPETRNLRHATAIEALEVDDPVPTAPKPVRRTELASAMALLGINRLVLAGILNATLGLFLLERLGDPVQIDGLAVGVATLTGALLALRSLIAMTASPVAGRLSDHTGNRWQVVAWGLLPGILGFVLLALAPSFIALFGLPLVAIASGTGQSLSTTMVGDLGEAARHSRRLGWLFTIGDLTSAIGPLLAYQLIPFIGTRGVYLMSAGLFGAMLIIAFLWASQPRPAPALAEN